MKELRVTISGLGQSDDCFSIATTDSDIEDMSRGYRFSLADLVETALKKRQSECA